MNVIALSMYDFCMVRHDASNQYRVIAGYGCIVVRQYGGIYVLVNTLLCAHDFEEDAAMKAADAVKDEIAMVGVET